MLYGYFVICRLALLLDQRTFINRQKNCIFFNTNILSDFIYFPKFIKCSSQHAIGTRWMSELNFYLTWTPFFEHEPCWHRQNLIFQVQRLWKSVSFHFSGDSTIFKAQYKNLYFALTSKRSWCLQPILSTSSIIILTLLQSRGFMP